jgi:hypothetical protein
LHPTPFLPKQRTPRQTRTQEGAAAAAAAAPALPPPPPPPPRPDGPAAAWLAARSAAAMALSSRYRRFISSLPGVARPVPTDSRNIWVEGADYL